MTCLGGPNPTATSMNKNQDGKGPKENVDEGTLQDGPILLSLKDWKKLQFALARVKEGSKGSKGKNLKRNLRGNVHKSNSKMRGSLLREQKP